MKSRACQSGFVPMPQRATPTSDGRRRALTSPAPDALPVSLRFLGLFSVTRCARCSRAPNRNVLQVKRTATACHRETAGGTARGTPENGDWNAVAKRSAAPVAAPSALLRHSSCTPPALLLHSSYHAIGFARFGTTIGATPSEATLALKAATSRVSTVSSRTASGVHWPTSSPARCTAPAVGRPSGPPWM
jgi:hypothetical protein